MKQDTDHGWRDILDFEKSWWRHRPHKDGAVRERFGVSPARYHQVLNRLIDDDEALQYDPMLVRRLRRLREERRRKRFAQRLGVEGLPREPKGIGRQA